jgi:hypothetical protein
VTGVDARTRADGTARFVWRLGLALGGQTLRVTSGVEPDIATLDITATATTNLVRALGGDDTSLCAVDQAGQLGCWRPLADASQPPQFVPHGTAERFVAMAVHPRATGGGRGCAVAVTHRLWCFETRDGAVTELDEVAGAYPAFTALFTGADGQGVRVPFCGLTADGVAWCWGENATGVLGDGGTDGRDAPATVATALRFRKLAVGSRHACGLAITGGISCWGSNASAQLGAPAGEGPITLPRRVTEDIDFVDVALPSNRASCGVAIGGGGAWCWGNKHDLGIGPLALALVDGDVTHRAINLSELPSPTAIARIDGAAVGVSAAAAGHWWGDLTRDVAFVATVSPRPFVRTLGFRALAMNATRGLVCGPTSGPDDALLCGRVATLTGYPSYQAMPELAGFGVPFP